MKWIEIENESKYNGLHYDFRSEEFSNIDRNMYIINVKVFPLKLGSLSVVVHKLC